MVSNVAYLQESSQSPLTSPIVDVPVASHPGQQSPVSTEERKNYVILLLSPSIFHFPIYCHDCYHDYMWEGEREPRSNWTLNIMAETNITSGK